MGRPTDTAGADPVLLSVIEVVRGCLPAPAPEYGAAQADLLLADLGFDSLRTVGLLVRLEEELGLEFPQELISGDTFRTTRTLSDALRKVTAPDA